MISSDLNGASQQKVPVKFSFQPMRLLSNPHRVSRHIVGMANVNAVELRELLIPLPKLPEQRRLMEAVEKARQRTHLPRRV